MKLYPCHINDPEFANALVDSFLEISIKNSKDSSFLQIAKPEANQEFHEDTVSKMNSSSFGAILYSPSDFPDARPGCSLNTRICMLCKKVQLNQTRPWCYC